MYKDNICPICRVQASVQVNFGSYEVNCATCGLFAIGRPLRDYFLDPTFERTEDRDLVRYLSAHIRQHGLVQPISLTGDNWKALAEAVISFAHAQRLRRKHKAGARSRMRPR
jgi:hypothetical protein